MISLAFSFLMGVGACSSGAADTSSFIVDTPQTTTSTVVEDAPAGSANELEPDIRPVLDYLDDYGIPVDGLDSDRLTVGAEAEDSFLDRFSTWPLIEQEQLTALIETRPELVVVMGYSGCLLLERGNTVGEVVTGQTDLFEQFEDAGSFSPVGIEFSSDDWFQTSAAVAEAGIAWLCPEFAGAFNETFRGPTEVQNNGAAFCVGLLDTIDELGDALIGTEYEEFLVGSQENPAGLDFIRCVALAASLEGITEQSQLSAYVGSCAGPLAAAPPKGPDPDVNMTIAEAACSNLLRTAEENGWRVEVRGDGLCLYLGFEPSQGQVESGLRPCD